MFRVRDFSRLTRVTIKTLRHYDRLGLLVPAFVDPASRYRHYAARQVARLHAIRDLRDLGFSLDEIARILGGDADSGAIRRVLERRRDELGEQMAEDARRLAQIEARLDELEKPGALALEAVVREVPPARVASRRARVADLDAGAQALFEAVEADVAAARVRSTGPPVLLYHDRDHRERGADIEAAVPVTASARSAGRSRIRTLPGHAAAACVVYHGGYGQWAHVSRALLAWLERRRLTPAGPAREVYLQFGASEAERLKLPRQYLVTRDEDLLTEMQIPVRAAKSALSARSAIRTSAPTPDARRGSRARPRRPRRRARGSRRRSPAGRG